MLERLKTQLAETKDIIKKRLDRPKDKYERPVRSKLKLIGAAMLTIALSTFTYHNYDAVVVSNVAFRATKFLDFFIPPASKDVANQEAHRRLHGRAWHVIRQQAAQVCALGLL